MLADPSVTSGEMLAALIKFCPEGKAEELYQALNELGEDRRGPTVGPRTSWRCGDTVEMHAARAAGA
jgi:hypothetical protein